MWWSRRTCKDFQKVYSCPHLFFICQSSSTAWNPEMKLPMPAILNAKYYFHFTSTWIWPCKLPVWDLGSLSSFSVSKILHQDRGTTRIWLKYCWIRRMKKAKKTTHIVYTIAFQVPSRIMSLFCIILFDTPTSWRTKKRKLYSQNINNFRSY